MSRVRKMQVEHPEPESVDLLALCAAVEKLAAQVSREEWRRLPADLSERFDEYACGLLPAGKP